MILCLGDSRFLNQNIACGSRAHQRGDYRIGGTSSYANKGYDGRNIGADVDQVNALTRNAVVGP